MKTDKMSKTMTSECADTKNSQKGKQSPARQCRIKCIYFVFVLVIVFKLIQYFLSYYNHLFYTKKA